MISEIDSVSHYNEQLTEYLECKKSIEEYETDIELISGSELSVDAIHITTKAIKAQLSMKQNEVISIMKELTFSKFNDRFLAHNKIIMADDAKYKDLKNADLVVLQSGHIFTPSRALENVYIERFENDSKISGIEIETEYNEKETESSYISHLINYVIIDTTMKEFFTAPIKYITDLNIWNKEALKP